MPPLSQRSQDDEWAFPHASALQASSESATLMEIDHQTEDQETADQAMADHETVDQEAFGHEMVGVEVADLSAEVADLVANLNLSNSSTSQDQPEYLPRAFPRSRSAPSPFRVARRSMDPRTNAITSTLIARAAANRQFKRHTTVMGNELNATALEQRVALLQRGLEHVGQRIENWSNTHPDNKRPSEAAFYIARLRRRDASRRSLLGASRDSINQIPRVPGG